MTYDVCKYERGQIWWINFRNRGEQRGHEQQKTRPWLILSIGKFNKSSGMFTAVPITTRDEIRSPAQVKFYNEDGRSNVVLCEQVRTFDYKEGGFTTEFIGSISNEVLDKVDVAISIHLGLHYSPLTLKQLYDSMEAIIKSVGHMQDKANTPKFSDDDVLDFAIKLQELASSQSPGTVNNVPLEQTTNVTVDLETFERDPVPTEYQKVTCDSHEIKCAVVESKATSKPKGEKKSPRIRWTPEVCKEFLKDTENLPMREVLAKWNISKKTKYYSMKNYAQSLLMKTAN